MMDTLAPGGVLVQVGLPAGFPNVSMPLLGLTFGQKHVVGSIVGGRSDMQDMLGFSAARGIRPMVETMPLSRINEAMEKVKQNKPRYRIVLTSE